MKDALFIIICLLIIQQLQAQSIRDSVFNDVIPINHQYVTPDGKDFLIDIPIKPQKNPIVIFNDDRRIPLELFCKHHSFLGGQNEIILITPDWKYYEGIRESEKRTPGLRLDPVRQNKFYHIKRESTSYTVDSISRAMELQPFTIHYKKIEIKENEMKYYYFTSNYTEEQKKELETLCKQLDVEFYDIIREYTETSSTIGVPGSESTRSWIYFILKSLTLEQKLPAIKSIEEILRFKGNDHLKEFDYYPKIYLPYTVIKNQ